MSKPKQVYQLPAETMRLFNSAKFFKDDGEGLGQSPAFQLLNRSTTDWVNPEYIRREADLMKQMMELYVQNRDPNINWLEESRKMRERANKIGGHAPLFVGAVNPNGAILVSVPVTLAAVKKLAKGCANNFTTAAQAVIDVEGLSKWAHHGPLAKPKYQAGWEGFKSGDPVRSGAGVWRTMNSGTRQKLQAKAALRKVAMRANDYSTAALSRLPCSFMTMPVNRQTLAKLMRAQVRYIIVVEQLALLSTRNDENKNRSATWLMKKLPSSVSVTPTSMSELADLWGCYYLSAKSDRAQDELSRHREQAEKRAMMTQGISAKRFPVQQTRPIGGHIRYTKFFGTPLASQTAAKSADVNEQTGGPSPVEEEDSFTDAENMDTQGAEKSSQEEMVQALYDELLTNTPRGAVAPTKEQFIRLLNAGMTPEQIKQAVQKTAGRNMTLAAALAELGYKGQGLGGRGMNARVSWENDSGDMDGQGVFPPWESGSGGMEGGGPYPPWEGGSLKSSLKNFVGKARNTGRKAERMYKDNRDFLGMVAPRFTDSVDSGLAMRDAARQSRGGGSVRDLVGDRRRALSEFNQHYM